MHPYSHIEPVAQSGESVLNDATGIVLFELCGKMILENASPGSFITDGFRLVLGGPLVGLAFFVICKYMLRILRKPNEQTAMTVCAAYLCYYVSEGTPGEALNPVPFALYHIP